MLVLDSVLYSWLFMHPTQPKIRPDLTEKFAIQTVSTNHSDRIGPVWEWVFRVSAGSWVVGTDPDVTHPTQDRMYRRKNQKSPYPFYLSQCVSQNALNIMNALLFLIKLRPWTDGIHAEVAILVHQVFIIIHQCKQKDNFFHFAKTGRKKRTTTMPWANHKRIQI